MKYVIYVDMACDINPEFAVSENLTFIPMEYTLNGDMRTCSGPETDEILKAFYDGQRGGDLTQTSQISPYLYETYFKDTMAAGTSILYLCLSSGLSSTYQSALLAKNTLEEEYPDAKLYVLDTLGATGGMGIIAQQALRNLENGMDIEDNFHDLSELRTKIQYWFAVPDLMYLKRGGRVGAASAAVGTALNIHPILKIDETGKLVIAEKKRGKKAAVSAVVKQFTDNYDAKSDLVVYAVNADDASVASTLVDAVKSAFPNADVRITGLSPIIGAHTGPGMFALCFVGK